MPTAPQSAGLFGRYEPLEGTWDEYFGGPGEARSEANQVIDLLNGLGAKEFRARQKLADATFLRGGITFSVYSDRRGAERIFPFDLIPRVIAQDEWRKVEAGLIQRVQALNAFLADVYGDQRILAENIIPSDFVLGATGYLADARDPTAGRRARPHRRDRSDPGSRRRVPGARGQRPDAVRCVVRTREPHRDEEGVSEGLLRNRTCAASRSTRCGWSRRSRRSVPRPTTRTGRRF